MIVKAFRIGFIGTGNMGQAVIKGLVESGFIRADKIYASNRSQGKLIKVAEDYGIHALASNQDVVDQCDIVFIAVKSQEFFDILDPIARDFVKNQIVVSLAAGVSLQSIKKILPDCRLVRVMPNTPTLIREGTLAFCTLQRDESLVDMMEQLLGALGKTFYVEEGEPFDGFTVSCSSGTGFLFEFMKYWKDWIVDYGIDEEVAHQMVIQTFLGTSLLALKSPKSSFEKLRVNVTSRQGVTEAGLNSMREQELERILRISFEKAVLRAKDLSKRA